MKSEKEMSRERQEPYKLKIEENRLPQEFLDMYPDLPPEKMTQGFTVTAETSDDWVLFGAVNFDRWGLEDATSFRTHAGVEGKSVEDMRQGAERMMTLLSDKSFQDKLLAASRLYSRLSQEIMALEDKMEDLTELDSRKYKEVIADFQETINTKKTEKDELNKRARKELYGVREESPMGSF